MNVRVKITSFFIVLLSLFFGDLFSQEQPLLMLASIQNRTGDPVYNVVTESLDYTLDFSFRMLDRYELLSSEQNNMDLENLLLLGEEQGAEILITGALSIHEDENISIVLQVYNCLSGELLKEFSDVSSSLVKVFGLSDALTLDMLNYLGEEELGFGAASFINTGETGNYRIEINGIDLGSNVKEVPRILARTYQVNVIQQRFEKSQVIFSSLYEINPDSLNRFEFTIPYLTSQEEDTLAGIKKSIDTALERGEELESLMPLLEEIINQMEDLSFCPLLKKERDELELYRVKLEMEMTFRNVLQEFREGTVISSESFPSLKISRSLLEQYHYKETLDEIVAKIAMLKRLQQLAQVSTQGESMIEMPSIALGSLSEWMPQVFSDQYSMDQIYLNKLSSVYLQDEAFRNPASFLIFLQSQYKEVWPWLSISSRRRSSLTEGEIGNIITQYLAIQFQPRKIYKGMKPFRLYAETGGGGILQAGCQWRPSMGILNFKAGVMGSYVIDSGWYGAIPVEMDLALGKKGFVLRLGAVADLVSYVDMDTSSSDGFGFLESYGAVVSMDLKISNIFLQFSNYLYMNDMENGGIRYCPSLGVAF